MADAVAASGSRPLIHVACGVLRQPSGEVLLAQRPEGKIAAGCWEFPGGKIEAGEPPRAALSRELHEELGITVEDARPLIRFRHEYSNRTVLLDTWLVTRFSGEPHGREGQSFAWVPAGRLQAWPQALPTVWPTVRALLLPEHYVFTPPDATLPWLLPRLVRLPPGALLRLRLPRLDDAAYRRCARALMPHVQAQGLRMILDRDPVAAVQLGADGWHASAAMLAGRAARAEGGPALQLASCHGPEELRRAAQAGFDAAVLGPVQETRSHPGATPIGWPAFADAAQYAGLPVYALGGVGPRDLAQAFAAYAQGVAGISAYWSD
ncbi:Nudix family hydrolase [Fontimonas sp. SYSU GA230001]|uniref:Nudix family hydrolase n=1 Tax=Fontimonas sp. SYSU GA230001 TaxID=3142450 RepID=UPI0032B4F22F